MNLGDLLGDKLSHGVSRDSLRSLARNSLKFHGPWLGPESWAKERMTARWRFWAKEDREHGVSKSLRHSVR